MRSRSMVSNLVGAQSPRVSMHRPLLMLALSILLSSCVARNERSSDDLFQTLGGAQGIDHLVEKLLDRCYTDERISFLFKNSNRKDLQRLISEQFCAESGGPCAYTGRSMAEAHGGLNIGHAEFDVFVEDLTDAMEDVKLPYRAQNRMLAIFAPMQPNVIRK